MSKKVDVVLASDNYYFPYILVAVKTLFLHNVNIDELIVHYIQQDVEEGNLNLLKKMGEEYNRKIDIIEFDMPKEFKEILPAYGRASKTTYIKFWFASMFPENDRVLYLDPDVLVMGSIEEMYDVDFDGKLIAGVIENLPIYHMQASHMTLDDAYINGGMVLCNLEGWRKFNLEEKALMRLKDTTHNLNYDQGIINELCRGKILVFPPKYNVLAEVFEFADSEKIKKRYGFIRYYSQKEINEAIQKPVIIHFTGFLYGKPLSKKCTHPYSNYFWNILDQSLPKYHYSNTDISIGQKIRKMFLRNFPFSLYLYLEKYLDIHRKRKL